MVKLLTYKNVTYPPNCFTYAKLYYLKVVRIYG